jgi:hypothetical protein
MMAGNTEARTAKPRSQKHAENTSSQNVATKDSSPRDEPSKQKYGQGGYKVASPSNANELAANGAKVDLSSDVNFLVGNTLLSIFRLLTCVGVVAG